jgi:xyloglucan galactosyltransferase MUR3
MASSRGSAAALRAGRCVLPLVVMVCCVLWMVLVLAPLPPELVFGRGGSVQVSAGEIGGTMERRDRDKPPAPGSGEMPFPEVSEHEKIIDVSPPPSKRRARSETLPKPAREQIVDASRSPPPTEDDTMKETPPLMNQEGVIEASPTPPHPQPKTESPPSRQERPEKVTAVADPCAGRYIYIQDLPSRFNADLLLDCRTLSSWMDTCKHVANAGMGPRLTRTGGAPVHGLVRHEPVHAGGDLPQPDAAVRLPGL